MALEGGHRFIKYLLIVFNFLFLLAGLALIIIGAVAAAKLTPYSSVAGVHFNGAGIFIIVIGIVIFIISLFGCLGAYKENYGLLIVFVILMIISFLALIAAIITAFVMRNQVKHLIEEGFNSTLTKYKEEDSITKLWDEVQSNLHCCGSSNYTDWNQNTYFRGNRSVPDSCCKTETKGCGSGKLVPNATTNDIYTNGCADSLSGLIFNNMVAVGGAAAAIAILQFIGILLACCLVRAIRKEYQVV